MRKSVLGLLLAGSLATTLAAPAFAAGTASATLSGFNYSLFDLNPFDGIAPSISFGSFNFDTEASLYGSAANWGTGFASIGTGASYSQAAASLATASAFATSSDTGLYEATAEWPYLQNFTLSANTLVVFSMSAKLVANTVSSADSATALAKIGVTGTGSSGASTQSAEDVTNLISYATWDGSALVGQALTKDIVLRASFLNLTSSEIGGKLTASASAMAAGVPAVPEPESYAMLSAGLGMMAWIARRRKTSGA